MEARESECIDRTRGAEIERISNTEDLDELVNYYYTGEPGFLRDPQEHWSICISCRREYPDAMDRLANIKKCVAEKALQRIEKLSAEFAAEFTSTPTSNGDEWRRADQLAAVVSPYSAHLNWQLYFLLCDSFWQEFTVVPGPSESSKKRPISACRQHLDALSSEALKFVFTTVLTRELYLSLFDKFWSMQLPTFVGKERPGGGLEIIENPDYETYQAYELRASVSLKYSNYAAEEDPLYGGPILLDFIREKLCERLQETPLDYGIMWGLLQETAAAYLRCYVEDCAYTGISKGVSDARPSALQPGMAVEVRELRSDLSDGIDSLRAGQMELRLAMERNRRSAEAFLPLIESRMGGINSRLHHTTKRLLALGEYFLSINQGEPDAMNAVVLHQAKACEHELYMRIFGPYIMRLLGDGITDYLQDGICKSPLLKHGKDVPRNMTLGNYCWYLKNDSKLREWIGSNLRLSVPALINEAYWINEQRGRAAHEEDFKAYDRAIFQERLFSPNGLLKCLHTEV